MMILQNLIAVQRLVKMIVFFSYRVYQRLQVPCLDGFSEEERLVGHFVNEINKKYPCTEHKGEHGNNGTCWKDADNRHVGLNN